jgi:hypothetical protein
MGFAKRAAARVGGFSSSVILSGVVNLVTIPFVIAFAGEGAWTSVAVGQSVGALVGILTMLGWAQSGPTDIARRDVGTRGRAYYESVFVRTGTLFVTIPVAYLIARLLGTESVVATFLMASSMVVLNLGASWFYVGEASPSRLLRFDALPRAVGIVAGTAAVVVDADIVTYAAFICAGGIAAMLLSVWDIGKRYGYAGGWLLSPARVQTILSGQKHGLGTAALSAVYLSLPLLIVQVVAPASAATYALADKIRQQALTAYRPLAQTLQGWTPSGGKPLLRSRVQTAWTIALCLGAIGCIGYWLVGPQLSQWLGGGLLSINWSLSIPMGIAFGMNIVSTTTGVACLVALGIEKHITISAAIGTAIAIVSIWPLTQGFGGQGTAWAVAAAQLSVGTYQSIVMWRHLNGMGKGD